MVKRLLDLGISLQNVKAAITYLREMGVEDLASVTLISDGASVYEITSTDELVDLLAGGQGVFAIAVGKVASETRGQLATLPSERVVERERRVGPAPAQAGRRAADLAGGWLTASGA